MLKIILALVALGLVVSAGQRVLGVFGESSSPPSAKGAGPNAQPVRDAYSSYASCAGCNSAYITLYAAGGSFLDAVDATGDKSSGCEFATDRFKNAGAEWSQHVDDADHDPVSDARAFSDAAGEVESSCHETAEVAASRRAVESHESSISDAYSAVIRCKGCAKAARTLLAATKSDTWLDGCAAARRDLSRAIARHGKPLHTLVGQRMWRVVGANPDGSLKTVPIKRKVKVTTARSLMLSGAGDIMAACAA